MLSFILLFYCCFFVVVVWLQSVTQTMAKLGKFLASPVHSKVVLSQYYNTLPWPRWICEMNWSHLEFGGVHCKFKGYQDEIRQLAMLESGQKRQMFTHR